MTLPAPVAEALTRLERAGFEAYVVGGCVRDTLMGKTPDDYDICTAATPTETEAVFSDYHVLETGLKHGTVTVRIDGMSLEITTFRTESSYSDGRHPDAVAFTPSLKEDLARRDFTVNAMAYSPANGLVDLFGGQRDIEQKILRCVGDPNQRFAEDALRILRALRFASVLKFTIDPPTADAAKSLASRLSMVSEERITVELKKALVGDGFPAILLAFPAVFSEFFPELAPCTAYDQNNPHHEFDLLTHLAKTVSFLPKDPILRLAGLLHDIGKPPTQSTDENGISHYYGHAAKGCEMALVALKRLKLSSKEIERVTTLIRYHDGVIEETEKAVKRRIHRLGSEYFFDLLALQRADHAAQTHDPDHRKAHIEQLFRIGMDVISNSECVSANQLAVNGHDMIAIGLVGEEIGKMLKLLLYAVMDDEVENSKEALMSYAQKQINPS